ncbi:hypothetical protein [Chryseobacterium paridis]|uniref:Outer membrane protein beta-barrel domain-containing protein n=1 Tax=Chryseobacterium paridis TaxID=2800328 RepID=A0ABS1G038_9FLAO|nr:hypothetical protein [Chryseobacterium paridis]MBK1897973.1 hypothetical protein [Chryseobacterium paridis]
MIKKITLLGALSISMLSLAQQKISIIPSVGYAWRVAKMPSNISRDTRDYIKGLKSGVNFDIAAYYNVKGNINLGVKYSNYSASSDGRITVRDTNTGQMVSGNVSTKDHINFFGPAFMYSNFNDESKHKFFYDVALGAITYTTKTGNVKGTGANLGLEADFAYQYEVSKHFFIGPKLGVTAGTLSKMTINGTSVNLGDDQKEGLTRLSLSAAATFRF